MLPRRGNPLPSAYLAWGESHPGAHQFRPELGGSRSGRDGWDGDHLHAFTAGDRRYSDLYFGLNETADEEELRVRDAFRPGVKKVGYTYDFGACWEHEIILEKRAERQPGQAYPVCIAFRGNSPVEYWNEDEPTEAEPFSVTEVHRRLAAVDLGELGSP